MPVYTVGIWTVQPGREDEFVELWNELAEWTLTEFPGATGTLLRNRDEPARFVSFGPWHDLDEIERWRSAPEWQGAVERIRGLLVSFEPGVYDVAASA